MFDVQLAGSLEALLAEKQKLLDRIVAVTILQTELIQKEEIQPLMDNIESRQDLIDAVNAIDVQVSDVARQMGEPGDTAEWAQFRAALRERDGHLRQTLLKIDEQDKLNERTAMAKIQDYQKDIQALKAGEKGVAAYNAPPISTGGTYFDEKK